MAFGKINKVLIANRGEIALRVQRACKSLNISSVSIASEADRAALHARCAETVEIIGGPSPKDSYLHTEKIIAAAKKHRCNAVHPGYGFLSENAEFAAAVENAGFIFIGPRSETIRIMGSKTGAREHLKGSGVPCTPGSGGGLSDDELLSEAERIGYPVLIKAVAGGGGRGMRKIYNSAELKDALPRARAEAQKNFSNPDVYLEKLIEQPRHVEVQIFGDAAGNVVHFGTRDCSTQRRHQKLIEEAPAPGLSSALLERIHSAAVKAAQAVKYCSAGTVEFLVKGDDFYFLEMNTRIQVEHPVSELISGVDLVALQIKVAAGEQLGLKQSEIPLRGHAIEFRIYAEDPANNFAPARGTLTKLARPAGSGIREDFGYEEGDTIPLHYDALISKFMVHGNSRAETLILARKAFNNYVLEGVASTLPFHRWLLFQPEFVAGPVDIEYVEREFSKQALELLDAVALRDPHHVPGKVEHWNCGDQKIEIKHRNDGLFLLRPVMPDGKYAPADKCRISNDLEAAKRALNGLCQ